MSKNGAFVALFKDNFRQEIFLAKRSDFPVWEIPGGGIEKGETPEYAATREVKEETGFEAKILRKIGVYLSFSGTKTFFYEGRIISGVFRPEFPDCQGRWFSVNKLPLSMTTNVKQKIRDAILSTGQKPFSKKVHHHLLFSNVHLLFLHPVSVLRFLLSRQQK